MQAQAAETRCGQRGCCWDNSTATDNIACFHPLPSYDYSAAVVNMSLDTTFGFLSGKTVIDAESGSNVYKVSSDGAGHVLLCLGTEFESLEPSPDATWGDPVQIQVGCPGHVGESEDTYRYCTSEQKEFTAEFSLLKNNNLISIARTHFGPIMISEELSEISFYLPSRRIFGPNMEEFMWSGTKEVSRFYFGDKNQVHLPFVLGMHLTGEWFMLWLDTGSPGEQIISSGSEEQPVLTWRTMGGNIKVHLLVAESLSELFYKSKNILHPTLTAPPHWTLGYHLCRDTGVPADPRQFGYDMAGLLSTDIPWDSDCVDQQLLQTSFTINAQYPTIANQLNILLENKKKFILPQMIQTSTTSQEPYLPCVSHSEKNSTDCFEGSYNGKKVIFPDTRMDNVYQWMQERYQSLYDKIQPTIDITGWTLHASRPSNDMVAGCEEPPFTPREMDLSNSLCYDLYVGETSYVHYHNKYSSDVSSALQAISPPAYHMSDVFNVGQTNVGFLGSKVAASWPGLSSSLKEVLVLGISGQSVVAMPACGTHLDTEELEEGAPEVDLQQLCLRWFQLAAFMPSMRSWYSTSDEDADQRMPHKLAKTYQQYLTWALRKRYQMLPYFYTLQANWAVTGIPLVRPMFLHYQTSNFFDLWEQFMVGPDLLVAPVLAQNADLVTIHIPRGTWYDFHSERPYNSIRDGQTLDVKTHLYEIPVFQRGGSVFVMYTSNEEKSMDEVTESTHFQISIALDCSLSPRILQNCSASTSHPWLLSQETSGPSVAVEVSTGGPTGSVKLEVEGDSQKQLDIVSIAGVAEFTGDQEVTLPQGEILRLCGDVEESCYTWDSDRRLLVVKRIGLVFNQCLATSGGCLITWKPFS